MTYLLDTNAVSDIVRENEVVARRLASLSASDRICISTVVRGELMYGLARLAPGRKRTALEQKIALVLACVSCEPVVAECADMFAALRVASEARGRPMSDNDAWIAATALLQNATLVSRDLLFQGIDGLKVEYWLT